MRPALRPIKGRNEPGRHAKTMVGTVTEGIHLDLAKLRQGDEEEHTVMYLLHVRAVERVLARRYTPDEVEDIVQETFFRAFRSARTIGNPYVRSWLIKIAINAALDYRRKSRDLVPGSDETDRKVESHPAPRSGEAATIAALEAAATSEYAQSCLSVRDFAIYQLHFLGDLSLEDTAGALGRTYKAVKQAVYRIRNVLKEWRDGGGPAGATAKSARPKDQS